MCLNVTAQPALYDFRRPNRFSREHVRALQIVNETFARQFALVMSTALRSSCQVSVTSVRQYTYDEYIRTVPNPSLLAVLTFEPLDGGGVFQLPMGLVMSVVDRLLGGPGGLDQPNRPLSEIEVGLVRQLIQRIVNELTYAFETMTPLSPGIGSLESTPSSCRSPPRPSRSSSLSSTFGSATRRRPPRCASPSPPCSPPLTR